MLLEGRPWRCAARARPSAGVGYLTEDRKSQGLYLDFDVKNNLVSNHLGDFCSRSASCPAR